MHAMIFALLLEASLANWQPTWLKTAEIQWAGEKPQPEDRAGISVFCGLGSFSSRTKVFISVQNRGTVPLCLDPNRVVDLSPEEKKRVSAKPDGVRKDTSMSFSCRTLNATSASLSSFVAEDAEPRCSEDNFKLAPGEIFESAYEFVAPQGPLTEFQIREPLGCAEKLKKPVIFKIKCRKKN